MLVLLLSQLAFSQSLTGTYTAVLTAEELDGEIDAAVEKGVSQFPFAIRWIARSRLETVRTWCRTYAILHEDGQWRHQCDDMSPTEATIPTEKKSVPREDGSTVNLSVSEDDGNVVVFWGTEEGGRKQTFKRLDDGSFILDVEIVSDRLDPNITWSIKYEK